MELTRAEAKSLCEALEARVALIAEAWGTWDNEEEGGE